MSIVGIETWALTTIGKGTLQEELAMTSFVESDGVTRRDLGLFG